MSGRARETVGNRRQNHNIYGLFGRLSTCVPVFFLPSPGAVFGIGFPF
jgi:hypothetical protein